MDNFMEPSSDDNLPVRVVNVKQYHSRNESQATRTGVGMPTYTIQHDAPWMPSRTSPAHGFPLAGEYYAKDDGCGDEDNENIPPIAPLSIHKVTSYQPSYHAHPKQHIIDIGPPARQTKLPIFKQVRSMLQKSSQPMPAVKYDGFSGEPSESGREAQVKPSTYVPPVPRQAMLHARGRSVKRPSKKDSLRDSSPISVMRDDEILSSEQLISGRYRTPSELDISPPVSPTSTISTMMFGNVSRPDLSSTMREPTTPPDHSMRRNAAPSRAGLTNSPIDTLDPRRSPSATSDWTEPPDDEDQQRKESHFSWTTYASSVQPATGIRSTPFQSAPSGTPRNYLDSRFSWSTVNTNLTRVPDSPPAEPLPPVPAQYRDAKPEQPQGLQVQSILSRSRPVDRNEKQEWTPLPRKHMRATATPPSAGTTRLTIPKTISRKPVSTTPTSGVKALPLPPELASPMTPLSHLENLLAQEKDLLHQRKNIEKGIGQQEKVVMASPLEVSFCDVRAAQKKLAQHQKHLAEIQLDVREVGVAISRARRKEGESEGLWVRRVTF
nr:hypothetical protein CFP56_20299 [Quercus suber]